MAPLRTPTRRELGRAGAAALLLAAGASGVSGLAGLASGLAAHRLSGPSLIAFAALEAAAAVLAFAALWEHGAGPPSAPAFGRWTRPLSGGFVLLVTGLPLVLLLAAFREGERIVIIYGAAPEPKRVPYDYGPWPDVRTVASALLALVVLAVVAGEVARRRRRRPAAEPSPDRFEEAAAAGSRALLSIDDPRAAVITCYTAMEGVLAEAGAGPLDSDTPAEVLARASGSGLGGLDAAAALTALFREARYSVHPMTERHRAEALAALESLRARSPA